MGAGLPDNTAPQTPVRLQTPGARLDAIGARDRNWWHTPVTGTPAIRRALKQGLFAPGRAHHTRSERRLILKSVVTHTRLSLFTLFHTYFHTLYEARLRRPFRAQKTPRAPPGEVEAAPSRS